MAPEGLNERGAALWKSLGRAADTPSGALALEACRTADRLDELDSVIHGKGVLKLMQFRVLDAHTNGDTKEINVEVSFSNVLAEARQQQMALKQMLTALGLEVGKAEPEQVRTALDELANRRKSAGKPDASSMSGSSR